MNLTKSARYALYAALEMALAGDEPVTVAGVARRHAISPTALAKVFQQLVRAGIAVGARGVGGGYRLARPASSTTVLDVMTVFQSPPGLDVGGRPRHGDSAADDDNAVDARLRQLVDEVDEQVRYTYASVTLDTLAWKGQR